MSWFDHPNRVILTSCLGTAGRKNVGVSWNNRVSRVTSNLAVRSTTWPRSNCAHCTYTTPTATLLRPAVVLFRTCSPGRTVSTAGTRTGPRQQQQQQQQLTARVMPPCFVVAVLPPRASDKTPPALVYPFTCAAVIVRTPSVLSRNLCIAVSVCWCVCVCSYIICWCCCRTSASSRQHQTSFCCRPIRRCDCLICARALRFFPPVSFDRFPRRPSDCYSALAADKTSASSPSRCRRDDPSPRPVDRPPSIQPQHRTSAPRDRCRRGSVRLHREFASEQKI